MYIQSNKLLPPSSRVIKPYMCSFIASEGPNIANKLNLAGVEIPYETQFSSRMILNPNSSNQPILYGFLGNNITFLLLKITYDETDPYATIEENQYVEYYFQDDPSVIRYANKLLLLNGNSAHRIPQIYLNNPTDSKIYVDVLAANLEQADINSDDMRKNVSVSNIYHNCIITDSIWNQTQSTYGSTQLQITNIDDQIVLFVDYAKILSVNSFPDSNKLVITTDSDSDIELNFLNRFEMYQAHSRINYVMFNPNIRTLSKESPSIDLTSPEIIRNNNIEPNLTTYIYPVTRVNGLINITTDDLITYFVHSVVDNRDGEIDKSELTIRLRRYGYVESLTSITENGSYNVTFSISDIANNLTVWDFKLIVDDGLPVITFNSNIGNSFTMRIPENCHDQSIGLTISDIVGYTIYQVVDEVDGTIDNSEISITVTENDNTYELEKLWNSGQYLLTYYVSDSSGNFTFVDRTITVVNSLEVIPPDTTTP